MSTWLLLLLWPSITYAKVACYVCHGNTSTSGKFCSIDNICTGEACEFRTSLDGCWSAGCTESPPDAPTGFQCSLDGTNTSCTCKDNFCNGLAQAKFALSKFWQNEPPFNTYSFHLPELPIYCMECGNVSLGDSVITIPCNEDHICRGSYCATKRGAHPHSFCGTSWEGPPEVKCYKNAGNDEVCVCPQQMCNNVLSPEFNIPVTTTNTTSTSTTPAPLKKKCKNGLKFSPNAQAVFMGEKLKDVILGGFPQENSVNEFTDGINTHICNYSEDDEE